MWRDGETLKGRRMARKQIDLGWTRERQKLRGKSKVTWSGIAARCTSSHRGRHAIKTSTATWCWPACVHTLCSVNPYAHDNLGVGTSTKPVSWIDKLANKHPVLVGLSWLGNRKQDEVRSWYGWRLFNVQLITCSSEAESSSSVACMGPLTLARKYCVEFVPLQKVADSPY